MMSVPQKVIASQPDINLSEEDFYTLLGQGIRRERKGRATLQQVGERIGVRFQQVNKYEDGANKPDLERFIAICRALRTTPYQILSRLHGVVEGQGLPLGPMPGKNFNIFAHTGSQLKEVRLAFNTSSEKKPMSQHDVSRVIGTTFQQVQKYEDGLNRMSLYKLWKCSRVAFGLNNQQFINMIVVLAEGKPLIGTIFERIPVIAYDGLKPSGS